MKICIDGREFARNRKSGISRYLETFLPAFQSRREIEIVLFVNDPAAVPESIFHGNVRCVTLPKVPVLAADQLLLPVIAGRERAQLFFSPCHKVPFLGNFKRIITVHDIAFLRIPGSGPMTTMMREFQLRLAARRADLILVDSQHTRADLLAFIPSLEQKINVLYPTLDKDWFKPVHGEAVTDVQYRYAGRNPYFLYVGSFKPHKNVGRLVRAFLRLKVEGKITNQCLILVGGDAANLSRIENIARPGLNTGEIRIYPGVDDKDLKILYSGARWFITASRYEGFGYPVLEAMARSCPVICNPCTSLPEIVGDAALFIEGEDESAIANALCAAITLADSRRGILGEKGRAAATRLIDTNPPDRLLKVVTELAGQQETSANMETGKLYE